MENAKFASLDIGTNTFRLLIAEISRNPVHRNYSLREICSERVVTRLGEGLHIKGELKKEAIDRSIAALTNFCKTIAAHNVRRTSAVATSALREAKNGSYFLERVKQITELPIRIISGEEEARITAAGMLIDLDVPESALMVDIGGGSTELIYASNGSPEFVKSHNTGVVYLTGKFMRHDPPLRQDIADMESEINRWMNSVHDLFRSRMTSDTKLIGTAGTVTALAAMSQGLSEFDHSRIHNYRLSLGKVRDIFSDISILSSEERAGRIPFEPARLDIIVPGTLILLTLMESFGFGEITVSNYGLREGILIELFNSED